MEFNRGFDDGYQRVLKENMKIGLTPLALPPAPRKPLLILPASGKAR